MSLIYNTSMTRISNDTYADYSTPLLTSTVDMQGFNAVTFWTVLDANSSAEDSIVDDFTITIYQGDESDGSDAAATDCTYVSTEDDFTGYDNRIIGLEVTNPTQRYLSVYLEVAGEASILPVAAILAQRFNAINKPVSAGTEAEDGTTYMTAARLYVTPTVSEPEI